MDALASLREEGQLGQYVSFPLKSRSWAPTWTRAAVYVAHGSPIIFVERLP